MKNWSYLIFIVYFVPDLSALLFSLIASALLVIWRFVISGSEFNFVDACVGYGYVPARVLWNYGSKVPSSWTIQSLIRSHSHAVPAGSLRKASAAGTKFAVLEDASFK